MELHAAKRASLVTLMGWLFLAPQQAMAKGPFILTTTAGVSAGYDDNIFSTDLAAVDDVVSGFGAGVALNNQPSPRLGWTASYQVGSQLFRRYSNLSRTLARQVASVGFNYQIGPRISFSASGSYTSTFDLADLVENDVVDLGRGKGQRYTAGADLNYKAGRKDAIGISYSHRVILYRTDLGELNSSDSLAGTWTHNLGPSTFFSLRAGPRWSEGKVRAHGSASISHSFRSGDVSLTYRRGWTQIPTLLREVESEGVSADANHRLGRRVQSALSAAVFRNVNGAHENRRFRGALALTYQPTTWLGISGGYRYSYSEGLVAVATDEPLARESQVTHNRAFVGISVGHAFRLDE